MVQILLSNCVTVSCLGRLLGMFLPRRTPTTLPKSKTEDDIYHTPYTRHHSFSAAENETKPTCHNRLKMKIFIQFDFALFSILENELHDSKTKSSVNKQQ